MVKVETEGCTALAQAAFSRPVLLQPCYLPFIIETENISNENITF